MPLLKVLCTNVNTFVRRESLGFLCAALALTLRRRQNAGQRVDRGAPRWTRFHRVESWPCGKFSDECLRVAGVKKTDVVLASIAWLSIFATFSSSSISACCDAFRFRRVDKGGPPSRRPCCDVGARQPRRQPGRAKQAAGGARERERGAGLHHFHLEGAAGDVVVAPLDDHHVVSAVLDHVVDLVEVAAKVLDEHLVTGSLGPIHTGVDEVIAGV